MGRSVYTMTSIFFYNPQSAHFISAHLFFLSARFVVYHYTPVASKDWIHLVEAPNLNVINLLQHSEFKPLNSGFFLLRF